MVKGAKLSILGVNLPSIIIKIKGLVKTKKLQSTNFVKISKNSVLRLDEVFYLIKLLCGSIKEYLCPLC